MFHAFLPQFFAVLLPPWIKGIEFPLDLLVSPDAGPANLVQLKQTLAATFPKYRSSEHPISIADGVEVLLPYPLSILLRVPPLRPPPESLENQKLHAAVRLRGNSGAVILRPSPQHRVQQSNQALLLHRLVRTDRFRHLAIERLDVLPARL